VLILDNCEQVVDESATVANTILRAASEVRILTTSRIALRVPGEQTYVVQPLPVPTRSGSLDALSKSTAVQLFVERAKLHKPSFALTEREAPAVADLVYRLEGIPLALELAAARVRSLSVADINKRLNDRYKILTGGDRTLQARQQTLRALVDWSYDLLDEGEQILLSRLSVFAGGFGLAAVETICGTDPLAAEDVLDVITSLVEKSLLRVEEGDDGARYRLLETIRDYAREKLLLRDEQGAVGAAHCDYFFAMAKAANRGSQGADQAEWTKRLEAELDNLRGAISLALAGGVDPIIAVKLAVALMWFWILRGYSTEGRKYVNEALALPAVQASDFIHGHALYVGATLAYSQGDQAEAKSMLERCMDIRRRDGKQLEIAATLSTLSVVRLHAGDPDGAREVALEAVKIFQELGDRTNETIAMSQLGQIHAYVGDQIEAQRIFDKCLAVARELEYPELESECQLMLGELALDMGGANNARPMIQRALEIAKDAGDRRGEATALWWLGKVDLARGDTGRSRIALDGALQAFRTFDMFAELLGCLEDHAALMLALGKPESAARLGAALEIARKRLALPRQSKAAQTWSDVLTACRGSMGDAAFQQAWVEGETWELRDAVGRALSASDTSTGELVSA
jgi:predicted ATPase